jgi:hypothetical protein
MIHSDIYMTIHNVENIEIEMVLIDLIQSLATTRGVCGSNN